MPRFALGLSLLAIATVFALTSAFSCERLWTSTLDVRNDTDQAVLIGVDTRLRIEVPPHSARTLRLGRLFGRWGTPDSVMVFGPVEKECSWSDVKDHEPLVIRADGADCDDVSRRIEGRHGW
ncbi:MAG: hypothetical protein HY873_07200 [Chloroflexi bacterium]|nr:hypothetical protein [Chloroflexota bacterium]